MQWGSRVQRAAPRCISLLLALVASAQLLLVTPLVAASPSGQPAKPGAQPGANDDAIIILDVSESMVGAGPGASNIWPQVRRSVSDLVDLMPEGTNIAVVPFSGGPAVSQIFPQSPPNTAATLQQHPLTSPEARARAKSHVDNLKADGQSTHIVPSLTYALDQLKAWRAQRGLSTGLQAVYIYTDGLDNEPGRPDWMADAANLLGLRAQDLPFLWVAYVQVGVSQFQQCREPIHCAPGVNNAPPPSIRLLDPRIDLPTLSATQSQVRHPVQLEVRKPVDVKAPLDLELTLEPAAPGITLETRRLEDAASFEMVVNAQPGVTVGNYKGSLVVRSGSALFVGPNRVPIVVTYQGPPTATPTLAPSPTATVTPAPSPTATTPPPPPTAPPTPSPSPSPPPPRPAGPLWPLVVLGAIIVTVLLGVADNFRRRFA